MGKADYYKDGDYNAICDVCGFKFKASKLRETWDGLWSCNSCWDPRHPQEMVRAKKDKQTPDTGPRTSEQPDTFIED